MFSITINNPSSVINRYCTHMLNIIPKKLYFNLEYESGVLNTFMALFYNIDFLRTTFITEYEYSINYCKIKPDAIATSIDVLLCDNAFIIKSYNSDLLSRGLCIFECKTIYHFVNTIKKRLRHDKVNGTINKLKRYLDATGYAIPVYLLLGVPVYDLKNLAFEICKKILNSIIDNTKKRGTYLKHSSQKDKHIKVGCILLCADNKYAHESQIIEIHALIQDLAPVSININKVEDLIRQIRQKTCLRSLSYGLYICSKYSINPHISLLTYNTQSGKIKTLISLSIKPYLYSK